MRTQRGGDGTLAYLPASQSLPRLRCSSVLFAILVLESLFRYPEMRQRGSPLGEKILSEPNRARDVTAGNSRRGAPRRTDARAACRGRMLSSPRSMDGQCDSGTRSSRHDGRLQASTTLSCLAIASRRGS